MNSLAGSYSQKLDLHSVKQKILADTLVQPVLQAVSLLNTQWSRKNGAERRLASTSAAPHTEQEPHQP